MSPATVEFASPLDDGLALTAFDLRAIADGLDSLAGAIGVRVEHVTIHGYRVTVKRQESQLDGTWYVVTGLEREARR